MLHAECSAVKAEPVEIVQSEIPASDYSEHNTSMDEAHETVDDKMLSPTNTNSQGKCSTSDTATAAMRELKCEWCEKPFKKPSELKQHRRIHTKEKPFQCEQCDKRFSVSSNLTVHRHIHTKEKPFQCEQCGKRFNRPSNLTRHHRVHTKEKPFQCEICYKRFSESCSVVRHRRIHSNEMV